jgi:hypothetical protein
VDRARHVLGSVARPRFARTLTLIVVLALVGASLVPTPAPVQAQGGAQTPAGQQTANPTPRPDLALALRDLPPGYEEAPSLELTLNDVPLQDRVIRQTRRTMTYQTGTPVTPERLTFLSEDLAIFLMRALSDVAQLSDWSEQDPAGLGSLAKLYTFKYRVTGSDFVGDGALALFGTGDYLSYLAVLSVDGQAVSDLRMLARVVSSRVDTQRTASSGRP